MVFWHKWNRPNTQKCCKIHNKLSAFSSTILGEKTMLSVYKIRKKHDNCRIFTNITGDEGWKFLTKMNQRGASRASCRESAWRGQTGNILYPVLCLVTNRQNSTTAYYNRATSAFWFIRNWKKRKSAAGCRITELGERLQAVPCMYYNMQIWIYDIQYPGMHTDIQWRFNRCCIEEWCQVSRKAGRGGSSFYFPSLHDIALWILRKKSVMPLAFASLKRRTGAFSEKSAFFIGSLFVKLSVVAGGMSISSSRSVIVCSL